MREIKFRAWHREQKVMLDFLPCTISRDSLDPTYWHVLLDSALETFDVMQYTGLKDKNGVEIYEGDIVHTSDGWGNEENSRVVWGDIHGDNPGYYPAFDLEPRIDDELNSFAYAYESGDVQVEVIGNIYENKELLDAQH